MSILTMEEVRSVTGADEKLISDTNLTNLMKVIEDNISGRYKVYSKPRLVTEVIDSNGKREIRLKNPYCLQVRKLQYADKEQDLNAWYIHDITNILELKRNVYISGTPFLGKLPLNIRVKYLSWFYGKTDDVTENTQTITAGDDVSFDVEDASIFKAGDYILIEGMDRNKEGCKIKSITGNTLTVDKLVQPHEAESLVTKIQTKRSLYNYILYETCLAVALTAIGSTYTFNTSYTIEGVSTTKGVPYPHFEKQANTFTGLRDNAKKDFELSMLVVA